MTLAKDYKGIMHMDTVIEEKLYRVVRKKDSHINTKLNSDGSRAAVQFTDDGNVLNGPVNLIEVDESELLRTEYVPLQDKPLTFKEIILYEVIAPVLRDLLQQALMEGYESLCTHVKTKVAPVVKSKSKSIIKDVGIIASGIKDGLAGKKPKALELVTEGTAMPIIHQVPIEESQPKTVRSKEEVEEVVRIMRSSAAVLAACIRLLNDTVMADDGTDPRVRLEIQRQLQALSAGDVMKQIELLLEDKNKALLDDAERAMLSSFREGYFLVNESKVPLTMYLEEPQK